MEGISFENNQQINTLKSILISLQLGDNDHILFTPESRQAIAEKLVELINC